MRSRLTLVTSEPRLSVLRAGHAGGMPIPASFGNRCFNVCLGHSLQFNTVLCTNREFAVTLALVGLSESPLPKPLHVEELRS